MPEQVPQWPEEHRPLIDPNDETLTALVQAYNDGWIAASIRNNARSRWYFDQDREGIDPATLPPLVHEDTGRAGIAAVRDAVLYDVATHIDNLPDPLPIGTLVRTKLWGDGSGQVMLARVRRIDRWLSDQPAYPGIQTTYNVLPVDPGSDPRGARHVRAHSYSRHHLEVVDPLDYCSHWRPMEGPCDDCRQEEAARDIEG